MKKVGHLRIMMISMFLGTGKTLIAGALATELNRDGYGKVTFIQRKGADILDKWVGESERKLRDLFEKVYQSFTYIRGNKETLIKLTMLYFPSKCLLQCCINNSQCIVIFDVNIARHFREMKSKEMFFRIFA